MFRVFRYLYVQSLFCDALSVIVVIVRILTVKPLPLHVRMSSTKIASLKY